MEANELRIGNRFYEQYTGQPLKVIGIYGVVITFDCTFKSKWQPLPLNITKEGLLNFGFDESMLYKNTYHLTIQTLNGSHDIFLDIFANVIICGSIEIGSFKYIHQLQNLYFALTGEELTTS